MAFAGTTLLSRGIVRPNRIASLAQQRLLAFQAATVRFFSVRGWASTSELGGLVGRAIVAAEITTESVPGPSRLAKVVLSGTDDPGDEVTVTWGLRHSRRVAAGGTSQIAN